jgi:4-amino-4-deoxy-L-arabinose transferase-like glycosyltransferase
MDIDAAQYASISREMSVNGHYLTVLHRNHDYLDKPPLLFWLSALSFKAFGVSTVAYKLPSFLFILLGFYATFRLGTRLYGKRIGLLSAALLASCEAFIFFTNDVRTDALLAASVIISVWQIVEFSCTKKKRHYFFGVAGIALAMLAKGPIGLMVPLLALGSYFIGARNFRMLFQWKWLGAFFLVLLMLSPMLWGLYRQYGTEGVKFYFWTQSFGRITGENAIRDSSGYFFFVHTFLWAFLPWMLIAYYGIGLHIARMASKVFNRGVPGAFFSASAAIPNSPREAGFEQGTLSAKAEKKAPGTPLDAVEVRSESPGSPDALLLGGILLPFIALSCSHYKLPHYIFVFFPLVAILTAKTILELIDDPRKQKVLNLLTRIQFGLCIGAWVFVLVCMTLFFPCGNIFVWVASVACAAGTFYFTGRKYDALTRLIVPSIMAILGVNLMLNLYFFPSLLAYQSGSKAAKIVAKNRIPKDRVFGYRVQNNSADFYMERIIPNLDSAALLDTLRTGGAWIYTEAPGIEFVQRMGIVPSIVDSIPHKHVTRVTTRFLNHKTREKTLGKQYMVRVEGKFPGSE